MQIKWIFLSILHCKNPFINSTVIFSAWKEEISFEFEFECGFEFDLHRCERTMLLDGMGLS
jgi:hypothetical protein